MVAVAFAGSGGWISTKNFQNHWYIYDHLFVCYIIVPKCEFNFSAFVGLEEVKRISFNLRVDKVFITNGIAKIKWISGFMVFMFICGLSHYTIIIIIFCESASESKAITIHILAFLCPNAQLIVAIAIAIVAIVTIVFVVFSSFIYSYFGTINATLYVCISLKWFSKLAASKNVFFFSARTTESCLNRVTLRREIALVCHTNLNSDSQK